LWEELPVSMSERSKTLGAISVDGAYLAHWRILGKCVLPICLLVGFVLGATHFLSRGETFTFSLLLMCVLLAISCFGGSLGLWVTIGYSVGDFFFFRYKMAGPGLLTGAPLTALARIGLPALLLDLLLFQLLAFTPLAAAALCGDVLRRMPKFLRNRSVPAGITVALIAILRGVVSALLVYVWVHTTPTLLRPVYTWIGANPPIQAIEPLQTKGSTLVQVGFWFSTIRSLFEQISLRSPTTFTRLAVVLARQSRVNRLEKSVGKFALILAQAVLMTFLLSGLLLSWSDAAIVFATLVGLIGARQLLGKANITFLDYVRTIPLILRFLVCAYICRYASELVVSQMWYQDTGFRSVWVSVLLSLVVFSLFIPGGRGSAGVVIRNK